MQHFFSVRLEAISLPISQTHTRSLFNIITTGLFATERVIIMKSRAEEEGEGDCPMIILL